MRAALIITKRNCHQAPLPLRAMCSASERKSQRQLNVARAASAEERIADGNVGSCRGGQEARPYSTAAHEVWTIGERALGITWNRSHGAVIFQIHQEVRQRGIGKIGVVEEVENVGAELHFDTLIQLGVFGQSEIKVLEIGTDKGIPAKVAEVLRPGHTSAGGGVPITRRGESRE